MRWLDRQACGFRNWETKLSRCNEERRCSMNSRVFTVLTAMVALLAMGLDAEAATCEQTIKTHAFLSRGQFQCGFRYYGTEMLEAARACAKKMSNTALDRSLRSGLRLFDFNEGKRGRAAMCASMLADFPKILRK